MNAISDKKLLSKPTEYSCKNAKHKAYKWQVYFFDTDAGERKRKFFKTKQDAYEFYDRMDLKLKNLGAEANNLSLDDNRRLLEAKRLLKPFNVDFLDAIKIYAEAVELLKDYDTSLLGAVKHFKKWNEAKKTSTTLENAVGKYLDNIADRVSQRRLEDQKNRLERFIQYFKPSRIVATITAKEVEKWLAGLMKLEYVENDDGKHIRKESREAVSTNTKKTYRLAVSSFFSYCLKNGYIDGAENPISKVDSFNVKNTDTPEIYTVNEARYMLSVSQAESDIRAFLAIGLFAGLRTAEIHRLTWEKIVLDDRIITLDASITKTSQRRIVKISDNLALWLSTCIGLKLKGGFVIGKNFRRRFEDWRKANNVKWIENGMRHSGASYHLAKYGNAAETAEQMGHSVAILKKHYLELVRPKEAEKYFQIKPNQGSSTISAGDIFNIRTA